MMEHVNIDCMNYLNTLGDRSIDMMIIDPPYYKVVKDAWDHQWNTEDEYYTWCKQWLNELGRVAKYSCSLWLFGYPKHLFHLLPHIESRGFNFKQQIVIDKGMRSAAGRTKATQRMYPRTTESVFYFHYDARSYIANLLKSEQRRIDVSTADINKFLGKPNNGGGVFSALTTNNREKQSYPTKEYWDILSQIMNLPPYHDVVYTFNSQKGLSDVWSDIDFYKERNQRIHNTQKPVELIQRIVNTSSNPGDTVLDIFTGSGTTPFVCKVSDRDFKGCEINPEYYSKAEERLSFGIIPQVAFPPTAPFD